MKIDLPSGLENIHSVVEFHPVRTDLVDGEELGVKKVYSCALFFQAVQLKSVLEKSLSYILEVR